VVGWRLGWASGLVADLLLPKLPPHHEPETGATKGAFYVSGYGGGKRYRPTATVMHPDYSPYTNRNDIALIFLSKCIPTTATVGPLKLATEAGE